MHNRTLNEAKRIAAALLLTLIALLTLAGCTEGERGIFATVAIEEEIKKNNLVDNATITGLVKTDIDGTEWYVAVAGPKVFRRSAAGNDWKEISGPGSRLALAIAGIDTDAPGGVEQGTVEEVYVVYQTNSGESSIFRLTDDLDWELATSSGTSVDGMVGIDEYLVASTNNGDLLVWDGSSNPSITDVTPTTVTGLGGRFQGVRDGVRYDNNGDGVVDEIATDKIYLIGTGGLVVEYDGASMKQVSPTSTNTELRGIGVAPYDASSILLLTSMDGDVYVTNSDTPAAGVGVGWNNAGDVGRPAADIVWVDVINNGTGAFLVATTSKNAEVDGRGYYQATITGSSGSYALSFNNDLGNSYQASDLAIASINGLRHFGNGDVFALTGGLGLWSTVYPPSGNPVWEWE